APNSRLRDTYSHYMQYPIAFRRVSTRIARESQAASFGSQVGSQNQVPAVAPTTASAPVESRATDFISFQASRYCSNVERFDPGVSQIPPLRFSITFAGKMYQRSSGKM